VEKLRGRAFTLSLKSAQSSILHLANFRSIGDDGWNEAASRPKEKMTRGMWTSPYR